MYSTDTTPNSRRPNALQKKEIPMTWLPPSHAHIPDDRAPSWAQAGGRSSRPDGGAQPSSGSFFTTTSFAGLRESRDLKDDRRDAEREASEENELAATGVPTEVVRSIQDDDWRAIKAYVLGLSNELNSLVGALVDLQLPDRPVKLLASQAASAAELATALRTAVRLDRNLRARNARRPDVRAALREIVVMARKRAAKEGDRRVVAVKRLLQPVQRCLATMRKY
jgi:hypothetical protein